MLASKKFGRVPVEVLGVVLPTESRAYKHRGSEVKMIEEVGYQKWLVTYEDWMLHPIEVYAGELIEVELPQEEDEPAINHTTASEIIWHAWQGGALIAFSYKSDPKSPSGATMETHFSNYKSTRRLVYYLKGKVSIRIKRSPIAAWQVDVPAPNPYTRKLETKLITVSGMDGQQIQETIFQNGFSTLGRRRCNSK